MTFIGISLLVIATFAGWLFLRGHYLLAIFVVTFSLYEFSAPFLYFAVVDDPMVAEALRVFLQDTSDETVRMFGLSLLTYLALASSCYYVSSKTHLFRRNAISQSMTPHLSDYYLLLVAIFIFGVISIIYQAGSVRLMDYLGQEDPTTPFFSYGSTLLVTVAVITLFCARSGSWGLVFLVLLMVSPLVYELFISSRRQHFAPSVLLILLFLLYSNDIRRKGIASILVLAGVVVFFGLQFWVRFDFLGEAGPEDAFGATLAPQVGEFVAIGSTSVAAWSRYVVGNGDVTYGIHWLFHALNVFPYIKLGNLLFPGYADWLRDVYRELAPYGGLSMLADSFLGGGIVGMLLYAAVSGVLLWWGHVLLVRYLSGSFQLSVIGIYATSLIATLLPKYRSGLGDAFHAFVNLSLLFFFFAILGIFAARLFRQTISGNVARQIAR